MSERVNVTIRKEKVDKVRKIQKEMQEQGRSFSNFAVESTIAAYDSERENERD